MADNPQRSALAQLIMNLFNQGQPFRDIGAGAGAGTPFPAAPPPPPGAAPTDMSIPGPWGAGMIPPDAVWGGTLTPEQRAAAVPMGAAPTPTPTPRPDPWTQNLGNTPNPYARR